MVWECEVCACVRCDGVAVDVEGDAEGRGLCNDLARFAPSVKGSAVERNH